NKEGECSEAEVFLSVETVVVPEAITPNGDGINDELIIKNLDNWSDNQLYIFNRREQLVFQQNNYNNSWKGEGLQEGVYFYILELEAFSGDVTMKKGTIVLLRTE
ncbi:MAG: gliding motility-associated-like protein, partial [Limisphaerales bacterium]